MIQNFWKQQQKGKKKLDDALPAAEFCKCHIFSFWLQFLFLIIRLKKYNQSSHSLPHLWAYYCQEPLKTGILLTGDLWGAAPHYCVDVSLQTLQEKLCFCLLQQMGRSWIMRQTEYCLSCYATVSVWKSLRNCFPEYAYLVKTVNVADVKRTWKSQTMHMKENMFFTLQRSEIYIVKDLGI